MEASSPNSPNQPVWGPPRDPLISREPVPGRRTPVARPKRRHPAARARQIAGWAAVASSASIVGYMVTANAQSNTTQSVTQQPTVVTPSSPTAPSILPTTQANTEGETEEMPATTPVTTPAMTPATLPRLAVPAPARTQPAHSAPSSSSHGS